MRTGDLIDPDVAAVWEALQPHLSNTRWTVEKAKSKLSTVMNACRQGKVQLVGVRDPLVMMSVEELAAIFRGIIGPKTWGELFLPTAELPGIEAPLRIHRDDTPSIRNLGAPDHDETPESKM